LLVPNAIGVHWQVRDGPALADAAGTPLILMAFAHNAIRLGEKRNASNVIGGRIMKIGTMMMK
jgi:hypothetical protein